MVSPDSDYWSEALEGKMVYAVQGITSKDGSFFIPGFREQGEAVSIDNFIGIRTTTMAKRFLYPADPESAYVGMAVISRQTNGQVEQVGEKATQDQVDSLLSEFISRNPNYGASPFEVSNNMVEFTPVDKGTIPPRDSVGKTMNQKESDLIVRYQSSLNRKLLMGVISHEGSNAILRFDAFDAETETLIEAKSSASRRKIREAIGQLLDYGRGVDHKSKMILLPNAPEPDLFKLSESLGIQICYETVGGFVTGLESRGEAK